jgi:hypothetical protein
MLLPGKTLPNSNPGLWMWSTSVEEDAAGRGNPVALGRLYAVCWLAPAGCRKKGDLLLEDKDRCMGPA